MGFFFSLLLVAALIIIALAGAYAGLNYLLIVVIPGLAILVFLSGLIWRIIRWGKSPVPFSIPTTCGQQKSLDWIPADKIDNPAGTWGVVARMFLEIFCFRSLFRNTKFKWAAGGRLTYIWEKWLWLAALLFHWSFFIILIRHLRLFTEPVPGLVSFFERVDSFFSFGMHSMYLTDVLILVGLTFLLLRRLIIPLVRYTSLPADYFPLLLVISIAGSGILMKYIYRVDIVAVKEAALGLVSLQPVVPTGIGAIFVVHLFLVSALLIYFPFSKLVHAGGILLSPTRNMANNSRAVRHVNPWNHPVHVHTYADYEDEFRKVMKAAGLPVDKEPEE